MILPGVTCVCEANSASEKVSELKPLIHSITVFAKDETINASPIFYEEVTSFEAFDDSRVGDFVKVSGTLKEDIKPDSSGNKNFTLVLKNNEL